MSDYSEMLAAAKKNTDPRFREAASNFLSKKFSSEEEQLQWLTDFFAMVYNWGVMDERLGDWGAQIQQEAEVKVERVNPDNTKHTNETRTNETPKIPL